VLILANFPDLQETAEKRQLIAEEHLDTAQKRFKTEDAERKREREEKCLHLFRLTESSKDVTYEWYKDRVEERVEGTCMWFLHHAHFLEWIKQDSGPLLVSADPGCGKSVLAKYLVDHVLPGSATVCYYFFKDQDQNTVRQALCALLHQLISKKPALIQHAMKQYEKDGESLTKSTNSLWTILQDAVQDPHAGSVIVVLDALDECLESEFENLMCNIESQLRNCQSSHSRLRYLMTSRPYEQIVDRFWRLLESFPRIHIPGEEEHEAISQEVNHVIEHRVNQLAYRKKLTDKLKENLTCNLTKTKHRTYLWVYLVFDHLETEGFKKTPNGIEEATRSLPRSVNEAYKQILAKSREQVTVRRALAIILAANRPFTLSELNLALEIKETTKSIQNDEIEQEEDFKPRLRSLCGLFVSVHHGKVYFLHQTAREFLLADPPHSTSIPQGLQWQHSITMQDAHKVLAECCVRYLSFLDSDASLLADVTDKRSPCTPRAALFKYSAKFWPFHFQDSCFSSNEDADISRLASTICDPNSRSFSAWSKKHGHLIPFWNEERPSQLTIASCFGHNTVVQLLLNEYADVNAQGGWYGNALQAASAKGHEQVVRMLLNQGANVNAKHGYYGSALQAASLEGYEQIVKMLLNEGANDNAQGGGYGNALRAASSRGYEQIVKMLLNEGANVNTQSGDYGNALQAASLAGYEQIVKILLNEGANVNAQGGAFSNALQAASVGGHEQVVEILINRGADVNAQGRNYGNALQAASKEGHEQVVKMLLDKGVNVNAQGRDYCTALQIASENGYEQVVKMLLDKGADVNVCTQGELHSIALYAASQSGYKHVVEMLLNEGANVNAQGGDYGNALQAASAEGYKQVVEILLDRGADVNAQGGLEYSNALQVASAKGHEEVVELLLDRGADVNAQGGYKYSSALEAASANDREDIVELLLEHGARWYDEDASPPSSPYP
jgi:ankyrin repeat protein